MMEKLKKIGIRDKRDIGIALLAFSAYWVVGSSVWWLLKVECLIFSGHQLSVVINDSIANFSVAYTFGLLTAIAAMIERQVMKVYGYEERVLGLGQRLPFMKKKKISSSVLLLSSFSVFMDWLFRQVKQFMIAIVIFAGLLLGATSLFEPNFIHADRLSITFMLDSFAWFVCLKLFAIVMRSFDEKEVIFSHYWWYEEMLEDYVEDKKERIKAKWAARGKIKKRRK